MKTIYSSAFQDDAVVLLSLLHSAGIEGAIMADKMHSMNPLFSFSSMGFDIIVPDEAEEDALALAKDYRERKIKNHP
ncbi:MAG: hypothetical protein CVV53_00785 [Spirochaetae bacterium HGW-Spirochaetae-9]|nr:MAG: hypothetical protein CVV53_00785 [Spirochaetae bacterium HGW-Spirochaetae-9]